MNAGIRDKHTLQALRPLDVANYLRANGWHQVENIGDKGIVWKWNDVGGQVEILLPLDKGLVDFANRMADLLNTLEIVERRSQIEIINDLFNTSSDLIRFRTISPDTSSGTIPLSQAVALSKGAEDLLLSAACAVVQPKPFFPRRSISEARDYLRKCRMGQSERGSFVLTVLSPVSPLLQPSLFPEDEMDEPFERKVILTLFSALTLIKKALTSDNIAEELNRAVSHGVSANLCEALKIMQPESESAELEVSVSWSKSRPVKNKQYDYYNKIRFSSDAFPMLEESARYLKQSDHLEEFEVYGLVRKLERESQSSTGKITVQGLVNERFASIIIELPERLYQLAIEAHRKYLPIRCIGELVKEGKGYRLLYPRGLHIEDD